MSNADLGSESVAQTGGNNLYMPLLYNNEKMMCPSFFCEEGCTCATTEAISAVAKL